MKRLTKEQIMRMHAMVIEQTGGAEGLRDMGILESCLQSPFVEYTGISPYPTTVAKAARLCYGLIKNHPFVDGNKRIGTLVLLVIMDINGMPLETSDQEIVRVGLSVADGSMDHKALTDWVLEKCND